MSKWNWCRNVSGLEDWIAASTSARPSSRSGYVATVGPTASSTTPSWHRLRKGCRVAGSISPMSVGPGWCVHYLSTSLLRLPPWQRKYPDACHFRRADTRADTAAGVSQAGVPHAGAFHGARGPRTPADRILRARRLPGAVRSVLVLVVSRLATPKSLDSRAVRPCGAAEAWKASEGTETPTN